MTRSPRCHRSSTIVAMFFVLAAGIPAFGEDRKPRACRLSAPPLEVYDRLADLKLGNVPALADGERTLLAKVWDQKSKKAGAGKFDEALLLDAMLFASGVEEEAARGKYREQFAELAAKAAEAVKDAKENRERGELLMKFLHAGVMKSGYEEQQTCLSAVFDSGKFNCVSSTGMYYLLGSRLGLDLRAISIPGGILSGHAALDMLDGGKRLQVEPTNPDGFDWGTKIKRPGVIVLGYVPDRKDGHEVDGPGIAAMIYSNRGVALSKAKPAKRLEAARCCLAALALDPLDESATKNFLSLFVNWGPELMAEKTSLRPASTSAS